VQHKRYKPKFDKLFLWILIPTALLMTGVTVVSALFDAVTLFFTVPVTLFVFYFLITPVFGYAELRESALFVKFGFFLAREIPYEKIRGVQKTRKFYSDSMLSLKNSLDHVNVKYNKFDILSVSVTDNEDFMAELEKRIKSL